MVRNETHAAHIGGQRKDFVDTARGLQATVPAPQVEQLKFVCARRTVLRGLQVNAAYPVSLPLKVRHQVMTDESPRPGDQYSCCVRHAKLVSARLGLKLVFFVANRLVSGKPRAFRALPQR